MKRGIRIATVTLGIVLASALAGALAAMLAVLLLVTFAGSVQDLADAELLRGAALIGTAAGAVLGPLASFGFLRRVPIWRVFAETALGAGLAGAVGFLLPVTFEVAMGIAAAGFTLAGARLAWAYRARSSGRSLPSAG